jgi:hypothetical protein
MGVMGLVANSGSTAPAVYRCAGADGSIVFSAEPCGSDAEPVLLEPRVRETPVARPLQHVFLILGSEFTPCGTAPWRNKAQLLADTSALDRRRTCESTEDSDGVILVRCPAANGVPHLFVLAAPREDTCSTVRSNMIELAKAR